LRSWGSPKRLPLFFSGTVARFVLYLQHFGLREAPFGLTADTGFFFACRGSQEALNTFVVALSTGAGFIKITGEVGTGKTMLCRKLVSVLRAARWVTPSINNPGVDSRSITMAIGEALGVRPDTGTPQHELLKGIARALLAHARAEQRVVLFIDECQAMPLETLETVRLLSNLETDKRKLLQVAMFGQPELDRNLAAEPARALRQRISFQHRLSGLAEEELGAYLNHRLAAAGYAGPQLFSDGSVDMLFGASGGAPRLVNVLADKALMLAHGDGSRRVERRHVKGAIGDTPEAFSRHWWWPQWLQGSPAQHV
jgi:MSHA biogenesis protein MshM